MAYAEIETWKPSAMVGHDFCILGFGWLVVEYLFPSPPSRITIATSPKGTTFNYFGERYRKRFARAGVDLDLRETAGALENLSLLKDPNSGVHIAFVIGGLSDSSQAGELLSAGLIFNVPFWIFYPSSEPINGLPELRGKRIAVGPAEIPGGTVRACWRCLKGDKCRQQGLHCR